MDANRKTAYYTLLDVETKKSYSNLALNHHIICGRPSSPSFVREIVYGVLENKMLLDYIIGKLVPDVDKIKVNDMVVLRMGIYQLGYMDSVPEYAAVNESVNLAKRFCKGREAFINAVLRAYIREKLTIELPDRAVNEIEYLSIKYSCLPWIIELWLEQYNVDFVEELLKSLNETPTLTIRLNWLKIMKKDLVAKLEAKGFTVENGKLCENALRVTKGNNLLDSRLYKQGMFSVQDEASMLVSVVLDPKQGDLVLDLCAAPGGKTFAIAERMNNKGRIIASDVYTRKLALIDAEAERLGVDIVETKVWDATKIDSTLIEKADRVLVDAPCSGLGVIRRKPEIKYKKMTSEFDMLPRKQLAMLNTAANYVKSGGVLVYSTCTINPNENQRVIAEFLKKNPAFAKEEMLQLLPNVNDTDGFFICKMRKAESIVVK